MSAFTEKAHTLADTASAVADLQQKLDSAHDAFDSALKEYNSLVQRDSSLSSEGNKYIVSNGSTYGSVSGNPDTPSTSSTPTTKG